MWFGPRRFGWGWDPASWEGWVATVVSIALLGAAGLLPPRWNVAGALAATAALIVTCILKGTRPGGPDAADRFREIRRNARRTPEMQERDRRLRQVLEDEPSVTQAAARLRRVPARRRRS